MKPSLMRARAQRRTADWYRITNATGEGGTAAEVAIYDEIGWFGVTAASFLDELRAITATDINLRLSSPGGEIFDGFAIYNLLRTHDATVTTYVDSLAASIASVIALAGDKVIMQPHSQMMIHEGMGGAIGDATDMREMADLLDRQSDNIAAVYADKAGGTVAEWRDRMKAETWYFADEAVASGLADEVAGAAEPSDSKDQADKTAAKWDLSIFNFAGREYAPAPPTSRPVSAVWTPVTSTSTNVSLGVVDFTVTKTDGGTDSDEADVDATDEADQDTGRLVSRSHLSWLYA